MKIEPDRPPIIHPGLVIPYIGDSKLYRIRIRLDVPISNQETGQQTRYLTVKGSCSAPMKIFAGKPNIIVVESELDGMLLFQEAGDLIDIIALGSLSYRPDLEAYKALKKADKVLIALDYDEDVETKALKQWLNYWQPNYPNAVLLPPLAKDPGDMFKEGINLREWIFAGQEG